MSFFLRHWSSQNDMFVAMSSLFLLACQRHVLCHVLCQSVNTCCDIRHEQLSSITHNLKDPSTLSQLSDVLFDSNQVNMNDSISKTEMNGRDIE